MVRKRQLVNVDQSDRIARKTSSTRPTQENAPNNPEVRASLPITLKRAQTEPQLLSPGEVMHLQRTLGNHAVGRLLASGRAVLKSPIQRAQAPCSPIQRKPADIDKTYPLTYDDTGKLTNVAAARARGLTRSKVINAQLKDGWVTPNSPPVVGGHLFKAEYGGPDDETNVVPWVQTTEDSFGAFEEQYKLAAEADAKKAALTHNAFSATVKTKATFADRPDLQVSESELDTAGWDPIDPDRAKRKAKYDDVAERFSGIPTTLSVDVTGLTSGPAAFAPTDIAPHHVRNDAAILPGFGVVARYERNATQARNLTTVSSWAQTDRRAATGELAYKKLGHVIGSHGEDFQGLGAHIATPDMANYNLMIQNKTSPDISRVFEGLLQTLIADTATYEQIVGRYMGIDVLHYVNTTTKLWFCTTPAGILQTGFKLGDGQLRLLLSRGTVG